MRYLLLIAFVVFGSQRLLTYLHIYQQEEYQPIRFIRWLFRSWSLDIRVSIAIWVVGVLQFAIYLSPTIGSLMIVAAMLAVAFYEKDPRAASKKRLVMTGRANRIYWLAFAILAVIGTLYVLPNVPLLAWLIPVHFIPFALPLANLMLVPYERSVQKRFWNEAHDKLKSLRPTVVAITGSYGKTSTKHLLGHILELQAPTLITPGSVNTPMGIARIVREQLGAHHRFFICEMGAYGPGSIARLCRLAPPDVGVITAIGMAHYERFKSLETVAKTKFELPDSVAARNGEVILAEQVLDFDIARTFQARFRSKTIVVGPGKDSSFWIVEGRQTPDGIAAEVMWQGSSYHLKAPIYGEHHISNMVLAFATACTLGVSPADAILALASAPQISHRLEVKEGLAGSRLIDDAYNSNPVGFASALKLLDLLNTNGGRRILVTPGMVELGAAHEAEHQRVGQLAGPNVDILLAVLPSRIASMTAAYVSARPDGITIPCASFTAAQAWLNQNVRPNDVVLMENDLPDLYEKKLRL